MKVLIATEKPFAPTAVAKMKEILEEAGISPVLLEKYQDKGDNPKDLSKTLLKLIK